MPQTRHLRDLFLSYAGQLTNVAAGAAILPLILFYLNERQFLIWGVFTAIAGVMLQCEVAIQGSTTRRIARIEATQPAMLGQAFAMVRRVFSRFATFAFLFLLLVGTAYLLAGRPGGERPLAEWLAYAAAFGLSYSFGYNAAYLVGRERAGALNVNNIFSRLCNLVLLIPLVMVLRNVWALVIAFGLSVLVSIYLNRRAANHLLAQDIELHSYPGSAVQDSNLAIGLPAVAGYAAFLMLSFWAYRSLLLADVVASADVARSASLALSLQLFALGMPLALVPVLMRVAPLVRLLSSGHRSASIEFARLHMLSLAGLGAFALFVLAVGQVDLGRFCVAVAWPSASFILLLASAFAVELTLQAVASVLVTLSRQRFTRYYIASVCLAIALGWGALASGLGYSAAVGAMLAVQGIIALPLMWREMSNVMPVTPTCYFRIFGRLAENE